jgi:hypothetical protein
MSKGIENPSFSELLKDLQSISEIKERLFSTDIIRLKELIIFLKDFGKRMYVTSMKRNIACPHETFEYSATHTSQYGFNYYDLEYFKKIISSQITELQKKPHKKIVHKIFYDNGFECFNFLVNSHKGSTPTIKLTAIYNVLLRFNKVRDNQNLYKDFIVNDFSSELEVGNKILKFSRFADITASNYTSTYENLIVLFETKFKTLKN